MTRLTVDALQQRARRAVRYLRAGNPSREALHAAANIIEALLDERYPLPLTAGRGAPADDPQNEDVCECRSWRALSASLMNDDDDDLDPL